MLSCVCRNRHVYLHMIYAMSICMCGYIHIDIHHMHACAYTSACACVLPSEADIWSRQQWGKCLDGNIWNWDFADNFQISFFDEAYDESVLVLFFDKLI